MNPFDHIDAPDLPGALRLLKEPGSLALAGGTDLLDQLKKGIQRPALLVNIKPLRELGGIDCLQEIRIGALASLGEIESHPVLREKLPLLIEAASKTGTAQLRHMGRLAGNLVQDPRCWYFRSPLFPCWLKGGRKCFAALGRNRHHAVIGARICHAVHPSDLAPALLALGGRLLVPRNETREDLPLESLYAQPQADRRRLHTLRPGELILEVRLPPPPEESRGIFLKAMERQAWSFALVSVAVHLKMAGDRVDGARILLGGVSAIPWRAEGAESHLQGWPLSPERIEQAARTALEGARPLADNAFKIPLAEGLLRRALKALAEGESREGR